VDLLLFNDREDKTLKAFEYLNKQTFRNKQLAERVKESYQRIKEIKKTFII
jgi:hypothetical protein